MLYSIIKNFLQTDFHNKKKPTNLGFLIKTTSSSVLLMSLCAFSTSSLANGFSEYTANYDVFRKGERHGEATRQLKKNAADNYTLKYESKIKWMIFSDQREESSTFSCKNNKIKPLDYRMIRTGTGPDRDYQIHFDHKEKSVNSNKHKFPLKHKWDDQWLDAISYQIQLRQDLKKGLKDFDYTLLDKKGNIRNYKFTVIGEEMITLPIGNLKTVKVKRLYDNDKRQATIWFAPSMDFMMVRTWKGEKGVEQFDIQLKSMKGKMI